MKKLIYLALASLISLNCSSQLNRVPLELREDDPKIKRIETKIPSEISLSSRLHVLAYGNINYIDLILALKSGIIQPDLIKDFDTKQYKELKQLSEQEIIKYLKPVAHMENPYNHINTREAAKTLVELLELEDPARREMLNQD